MPGISDLLDSDMETNNFIDENSLISSVSDTTAIAQAREEKKPRKRVCVGMPKKKPRASAEPKTRPQKRKATAVQDLDEDDLVEHQPAKPQGRRPKEPRERKESKQAEKGQRKPRKKDAVPEGEEAAAPELGEEAEAEANVEAPSPVNIRSNFATTTTKRAPKPVQAKAKVRRTPVEEPEDRSESIEDDIIQQPAKRKCIRPEPITYRQHRAGSVSSTGSRAERDPLLRRKLGDMTQKYQNIDHKYRNLKDVAIAEANDNVEKMRRQCEAVSSASEQVIASLKAQVAAQNASTAEAKKLKKEIQARDAEIESLKKAHESVLKTLGTAQTEIKALQAKLTVARATPAPVETKQPVTAKKTTGPESDRIAQLKIDLYGDLTGLIVRGVKQSPDGDTYDCIQTGRNGTLHFKLFVDAENAKNASFEQTEFLYTPLLDANRDKDLIGIMPDYLAEDITFEREVAAKFYARVVKTLTEKVEFDEGEE